MTGDAVRQVCEAMLPQDESDRRCETFGVSERERKLNRGMCVRAMVISAGTPGGAYPADVLRSSREFEGPRVARSACSRWCDEPLARCMEALADRAWAYARAQQVDLPGPRSGVKDWSIVDATTVMVRNALSDAFPGTGDDAALHVPTGLSVGGGAPVRSHCSPARDHDRRPLTGDESWRGYGRLADLASASLDRLGACEAHGVCGVIRLTDTWKPNVDDLARGQVTHACFPGTDLDALLEEEPRVLDGRALDGRALDGRAIDADGPVGGAKHPRHLRLVGVQTPQGSCCFLTHLLSSSRISFLPHASPPPNRPAAGG
jgi:hypothetical protein